MNFDKTKLPNVIGLISVYIIILSYNYFEQISKILIQIFLISISVYWLIGLKDNNGKREIDRGSTELQQPKRTK